MPNIVTIYDVGSEAGDDFFAMEFVAGQALDRRISTGGLRLAELLKHAIQVTDALGFIGVQSRPLHGISGSNQSLETSLDFVMMVNYDSRSSPLCPGQRAIPCRC